MLEPACSIRRIHDYKVPDIFIVRSRSTEEIGFGIAYKFTGIQEIDSINLGSSRTAHHDPMGLTSAFIMVDGKFSGANRIIGKHVVCLRGKDIGAWFRFIEAKVGSPTLRQLKFENTFL